MYRRDESQICEYSIGSLCVRRVSGRYDHTGWLASGVSKRAGIAAPAGLVNEATNDVHDVNNDYMYQVVARKMNLPADAV